ncbi:MAG: AAA family ATPase [Pseudolabrys sp.]|nr:AAA family ATPase [Pseudolabrys sp.]
MTRFEPTLIVTQLVVERAGRSVYDEIFHEGVNVIRGENSSGKSTILNFIFYGLGGDLADWSEDALQCSRVTVEVRLNGNPATLSREISKNIGQPMDIFGGSYVDAVNAPRSEWVRYPYRRSQSQESFSQALFRLLGLPEVTSEASSNLTMHQILRLLYSDQLSPVENLFRFESRFDPPILRDAIGRLLSGAYESALYGNEVKIRELTREFDAAVGEQRSLFQVVGKTGHSLTMDWLDAERRSLRQERDQIQTQVEAGERELFTATAEDALTLKAQEDAYSEVQHLQSQLSLEQRERDALSFAIADSGVFIRALEAKITALRDSASVAEHFGDITFGICPACYAPIETAGDERSCHLCKAPFDPERARGRIVAIVNEASVQIKQSRVLQERREQRLKVLEEALQRTEGLWKKSADRLSKLQRLPSTEARQSLRQLQQQAGYLNRQIEDLEEKSHIIKLIDEISARKDVLNNRINNLKMENERLRAVQERRLTHAYTLIADQIRELLRHDLRRQDSFESPERIEFDFAQNKITVDGHSYFSASSRVILRSSFFLGFFSAATKDPAFRHPRFVMIDTTEDKGMEPERSHNFQNQILRISRESNVEHQIIYATAMISPDLDDEDFTIGKFSTRDDPTLDFRPLARPNQV